MLLIGIAVVALGCDAGSLAATGVSPVMALQEKPAAIDVGVILSDRAGYFCLPIERLGIEADETLISVESSCECIQPSLVKFVGSDGSHQPAILLEYVDESAGSGNASNPQSMNLGVIITVELASGKANDFTVTLLHTVLATVDPSSEVRK